MKKKLIKKISDTYYMYRAKRGLSYSVIIERGKPDEIETLFENATPETALKAAQQM